ncbi:MAG: glycine/betaine ABC transporter, partial [Pseudomonadota bacterium]
MTVVTDEMDVPVRAPATDDIKPETAARLDGLVRDFTVSGAEYYAQTFAYMLEAPGYRFTLNWAAGLLGPVWFGARGLWGWFLTFLILECAAFIQIGRGLFGDLGRTA